jgi:signal transduction histidine kinase
MNIQRKTIFFLIGIFVVYTLVFSGFIYNSISNHSFADFYKRLEIRAAITAKIVLEETPDSSSIKEMHQEYLEKLPNQYEYIVELTPNNKFVYHTTEHPPLELLEKVRLNNAGGYQQESLFYSGILYKSTRGKQYIVVVSAENAFYKDHIAYLRNLLFTSLGYALLLVVLISLLISRTIVQPVKNIITEVGNISTENLHLRLETPKQNDFLSNLTSTFNSMLNRIETSFETQKNFISNASHELNTPLTSIIGEADFALSKPRSSEEYVLALTHILEEAETLDKKTKALLFLAQTGYSGKSQKFDKIRVDQLILDVMETVQKINPQFKISLDFSLLPENPEKLKVKGNEQLLHLALSNIVMNACKYSNGQTVTVSLGASDKAAIINVRDLGIGIPADELQYIYHPYFRASNTENYDGYGIGLPLARNIVLMHEGLLDVTSQLNKGTSVQLTIPLGNYTL